MRWTETEWGRCATEKKYEKLFDRTYILNEIQTKTKKKNTLYIGKFLVVCLYYTINSTMLRSGKKYFQEVTNMLEFMV
jgi:hypothetical protein